MKKKILIIIINLWKMLVGLPRFLHKPLGYLIGMIFYIFPIKRNLYSKKNINLCFKDLNSNQRKKIHKKNILNPFIRPEPSYASCNNNHSSIKYIFFMNLFSLIRI